MLSEVQKIASVLAEDTESRVGISDFYWTETNVSLFLINWTILFFAIETAKAIDYVESEAF